MIHTIRGRLIERKPTLIVVEVNGIGYEVNIPLSTFEKLPEVNQECFIWIHHHIREGSEALYGFASREEREFFQLLISISGIGPRLAIGMMSGTSVDDFRQRIISGDIKSLTALPGIGPKTAKRIIVELKEKFVELPSDDLLIPAARSRMSSIENDAFLALLSLGYRKHEAQKVMEKVRKKFPEIEDVETYIKVALKEMES